MSEVKKLTVNVNGQDYVLNHTESDEYIHQISKYVNQKIKEASVDGMKLDSNKSAVMACINLTDELFKCRQDLEEALAANDELIREKRELEIKLSRISADR